MPTVVIGHASLLESQLYFNHIRGKQFICECCQNFKHHKKRTLLFARAQDKSVKAVNWTETARATQTKDVRGLSSGVTMGPIFRMVLRCDACDEAFIFQKATPNAPLDYGIIACQQSS